MVTDKILITAPIDTESGYGHKAREIVDAIVKKYGDLVEIGFTPWGDCQKNALSKYEKYEYLLTKKKPINLMGKPSIHVHVGLPFDFDPKGEKNILFTSGVETNIVSLTFIKHINEKPIDLVVVPSVFVRDVLINSSYTHKDTKQEFRITKEIVVIPESFYPDFLEKECTDEFKEKFEDMIKDVPEKLFFSAGQMQLREVPIDDRKNMTKLVQQFVKTFRGNKHVGLLLKANGVDTSNYTKFELKKYIDATLEKTNIEKSERPPIFLLFGDLKDEELYYVMNHPKIICHAYFTHGEGFGRFILQSTLTDKPLIVPRIGGHRDFTQGGRRIKFADGDFKTIPNTAHMPEILIPESKWFHMNDDEIYDSLYYVYKNHKDMNDKGKMKSKNAQDYYLDSVQQKIVDVVDKHHIKEVKLDLKDLTKNLNIPKLEKIN